MESNSEIVDVLEQLIETCKDGEMGYKDAAEHITQPYLRTLFTEQSTERARFVRELEAELARTGEPVKKESGSVSGAMHRAWIDLKSNLGAGDKSILASVEQGEDNAKAAYEEALKKELPSQTLAVIRQQSQSIRSAHDKVKSLRDSVAA
jgi:uncharacterized protein (TIGR02284 family)